MLYHRGGQLLGAGMRAEVPRHRLYGRVLSGGEMDSAGKPLFACLRTRQCGDLAAAPPLGAPARTGLGARQQSQTKNLSEKIKKVEITACILPRVVVE